MHVTYGSAHIEAPHPSKPTTIAALPLPVLGVNTAEALPIATTAPQRQGSFHTWQDGELTLGFVHAPYTDGPLPRTSEALYNELFELTKGQYLFRIWNYLPLINQGPGDQEVYKQFSAGRAESFHRHFGEKETAYIPAGTCVGLPGDQLAILFIAGNRSPDHHENPDQTPAYRYPRQYGPKSPSFARATTGEINGIHHRFISGTAAVIGYESKGIGDLATQVTITCDNLERISAETLAHSPYRDSQRRLSAGKVYLRHPSDYPEAKALLEKRFPDFAEKLIYLQSDICRQELLVEIELAFTDAR